MFKVAGILIYKKNMLFESKMIISESKATFILYCNLVDMMNNT